VPPTNPDHIGIMPNNVTDSLATCPRCGDPHDHLTFHRFARPPAVGRILYWSVCPITGEPILAEVK